MKRLLPFLLILPLVGCASFRALMPGGVTPADAEWVGVKTGPALSVASQIDPRAAAVEALLSLLGQSSQLGVLMPVSLQGEAQPRWVLCAGDFAARCTNYPINTVVHFAGRALGPGLVWQPSRLTADGFND